MLLNDLRIPCSPLALSCATTTGRRLRMSISRMSQGATIGGQVDRGRRGWTGDQVDSLLMDTLLIFGSLAILLAPMALALAIGETKPGGAGWKLLTFICCAVAAWFLFFAETSGLVIAFVAWLLAWGVALVMRMSFNRRLA